jgi:hypothetical protein
MPLFGAMAHSVLKRRSHSACVPIQNQNDDIALDYAQRAVSKAHPCGVDRPGDVDVFELQTWMVWVVLKAAVRFTSPALDMIR